MVLIEYVFKTIVNKITSRLHKLYCSKSFSLKINLQKRISNRGVFKFSNSRDRILAILTLTPPSYCSDLVRYRIYSYSCHGNYSFLNS